MDESYTSLLAAGIEQKYRRLEMEIMEDVIRRIRKAGSVTSVADWQMQRLFVLRSSQKNIEQLMRKAVDGNEAEVRRLYEEVISREYTRSRALYEAAGREFIPYEQNLELRQITNALIAQSSEELYNITKSAGFMLADGHGGKVFTPLSDVYNGWLDNAMLGMAHGAYDYNTLVRRTVSQMTASGLRSGRAFRDGGRDYGIDYASGWHNRIDVAVRRALLTGFGQLAGQIADRNAQQLHTQYFEVTWHPASRPSHAVWQGKVYTKEELVSKCGLGTGPGLHGWNCRHDYYPFLPGVSERSYSDKWLEAQNRREMTPTRYKGKEYTAYEATQKQRQMETVLRAQRERVQLLREGGAEKDEVTLAQCRYQAQLEEYRRFSRTMGLQEQTERIYTGRTRGRISPSPQAYSRWQEERAAKKEERAAEPGAKAAPAPKDVTQKYLDAATPGKGRITYEDGYKAKNHRDEIDMANWIHRTFGGDIELLKEMAGDGLKRPDYMWNKSFWELKGAHSINGADKLLQHAIKQIHDNPGGVILDILDDVDRKKLEEQLMRRFLRSDTEGFDLILLSKGELVKVLRLKK